MFITKTKHRAEILGYQTQLAAAREETQAAEKHIAYLKERLVQAESLKTILDKLTDKLAFTVAGQPFTFPLGASGGLTVSDLNGIKTDNIAHYVPDHFGGQVIKQEATKVIEIDKDGSITTGLTRQAPDNGYSYVLIRR